MNSLQDLNAWGNAAIEFGNQADYSIVINNTGNVAVSEDEENVFLLPQRIFLTTYTNAYTDLLVTFTVSRPQSVLSIDYTGNNTFITLLKLNSNTWRAFGIRSTERLTDLFVTTLCSLAFDQAETFTITVSVDDQLGNTSSYVITVNVSATPEFSIPTALTYNEDFPVVIQPVSVLDGANTTYTVTIATPGAAVGTIQIGNGTPNVSQQLSGTKAEINAIFAAGEVIFQPFADFTDNTVIFYSQIRTSDNVVHADQQPIGMNIGNTHAEFTISPTSTWAVYDIDRAINQIRITDLAANKEYTSNIVTGNTSQTFGGINYNTRGNLVYLGNVSQSLSFTGTKAQGNVILASGNIAYRAFNYGTTHQVLYSQTQNTDSLVQASNVPIQLNMAENPQFYFIDTVLKSSQLPALLWSTSSADQFRLRLWGSGAASRFVAGGPRPAVTFTYLGSTTSTLQLTGTQAELQTKLSQVTVNDWEQTTSLKRIVVVNVINDTQNRFIGRQNFFAVDIEDQILGIKFRFGAGAILRTFRCGLHCNRDANESYPAKTPWRVLESNFPQFLDDWSITFTRISGANNLFRWKEGGTTFTGNTVTFTGTASSINEKIHWNNLQVLSSTSGITEVSVLLTNLNPALEFGRTSGGRAQLPGGSGTSAEFVIRSIVRL
jgi:hypothetical protein